MISSLFGFLKPEFGTPPPDFRGDIGDIYKEAEDIRLQDDLTDVDSSSEWGQTLQSSYPKYVESLKKLPNSGSKKAAQLRKSMETALTVSAIAGAFFVCVAAALGAAYLSQHGGIGPNLQIALQSVKSGVQTGCHWVASTSLKAGEFLYRNLKPLDQLTRHLHV